MARIDAEPPGGDSCAWALWFDTWSGLARILVVGAAAYAGLLLVFRISGKRTLAKLHAFDFVVTVALGSTLASVLLNTTVAWAVGVTALALLAGWQFAAAVVTTRAPWTRTIVTQSRRSY